LTLQTYVGVASIPMVDLQYFEVSGSSQIIDFNGVIVGYLRITAKYCDFRRY